MHLPTPVPGPAPAAAPPLLLRNARLGLRGPVGELLIRDGRIAPPGAGEAGAECVDLDGATVLPGLWDAHVHSVQWAQARRRIDLSGAGSAREAVQLIESAARPGELTIGYGFRDALWPDALDRSHFGGPRSDLAAVLISNDLHTAWFSPAAQPLVGAADHPTGVLRERDCYAAMAALPAPDARLSDRWIADATAAAAARGVVGLIDFEYADNAADWARRAAEQEISTRVVCTVPRDRLDRAIADGLRTGAGVPEGSPLLTVGPVKIFADGSLNTRTAFCDQPYPGAPADTGHGRLELPAEELHAVMDRAAAHGLRPAVHAIGDRANALALDAFERIGCPGRIEHAQLVRREDFARFGSLARSGLVAGVQPAHAPDDREVADTHWKGRTDRAFAYAGLLAAGAVLELGSDAPVAPLDPWDAIASAVARTDDGRPAWHPEQALTLRQALTASSRGRSAIRPGDPADLVVLAADPAAVLDAEDPGALRSPAVLGTLLAGRWTYRTSA
jgi:hypothetical protein